MKAKNVKVGVGVVVKDCAVGYVRHYIGKRGVIDDLFNTNLCWVEIGGESSLMRRTEIRKMKSSDLDEAPIHPMQEHLGKEVVLKHNGRRGWVVGLADDDPIDELLVDFGSDYKGHRGRSTALKPYHRDTCGWCYIEDLRFLTEDEE